MKKQTKFIKLTAMAHQAEFLKRGEMNYQKAARRRARTLRFRLKADLQTISSASGVHRL